MSTTEEGVRCTRCGSTQIHAEKRGWNIWTGVLRSGRIIITCLKCGNRFRPGDRPYSAKGKLILSAEEQAALDEKDTRVGMNALGLLLAFVVGLVLVVLVYQRLFP